ncbi:MAG: 2-amino-4-hydroxy-6-hydroxymethyldihydropteridine diphosphokinase [Vampirovibrionales bacterium]
MPTVFLGMGSNLDNPEAQLNQAVEAFTRHPQIEHLKRSSWHASSPMHCPEGSPDFLNGVVMLETTLSPKALQAFCQTLETQAGRPPLDTRLLNAPRPLDVDILFYGDLILQTADLVIPHPRLQDRAFVLEPMLELAPDWEHPILKLSVTALFKALSQKFLSL